MPISQERMTLLLVTIKHYKDSTDILRSTIDSYTRSSTDPQVLLTMLSELAASQKLPDNLYENYVQEVAHFKAHGALNLAKRRYTEKKRLKAEATPLSGAGVEGLKLEHAERAKARLAAKAKPDKRQKVTPPPPDTPREAIQAWEVFHDTKYDWSQWTGQPAEPAAPMQQTSQTLQGNQTTHTVATTVKTEDGVLILADDVDFPPDEVDGQEDARLEAIQQALIANNRKFQHKEN